MLLLLPLAEVVMLELFPPGLHKSRLQPFLPLILTVKVQYCLQFFFIWGDSKCLSLYIIIRFNMGCLGKGFWPFLPSPLPNALKSVSMLDSSFSISFAAFSYVVWQRVEFESKVQTRTRLKTHKSSQTRESTRLVWHAISMSFWVQFLPFICMVFGTYLGCLQELFI